MPSPESEGPADPVSPDDPLSAARGLANGLVLGVCCWAFVGLLLWYFWPRLW